MRRIIECVPNFSEGRDSGIIDSIAEAIAGSADVKLLHVDPGEATNRTVYTFAGSPEAVTEAAFQGVRRATELIDMRRHHGTHPRSGACDVLPLIPVAGVSLEECAGMARKLAERIFVELGVPCYCYEAAAFKAERRNLAVCRAGEYEALAEKIADPQCRPDFSPESLTEAAARGGASNVGARNFLIAVNFNLNSKSEAKAKEIAADVREKGDAARPFRLMACKAIGWYIEEYDRAQVSMNMTDISITPLHLAFEQVSNAARARGLEVTGTEIIGLVPKCMLTEAGKYFMAKEGILDQTSEEALIDFAIRHMGLDELKEFKAEEKVLEYLIETI